MNVDNGEIYGLGSSPDLRPVGLRQAARLPPAGLRRSSPTDGHRRADLRPRDPGLLSDRLDLQADHRAGGARLGRDRPERDHQRHRRRSTLGDGQVLQNAGDAVNGAIDLRQALQVSSDVFFYTLGARMNDAEGDGGPIQEWARELGIGEPTGLDIGGEGAGLLPTPEWRNDAYERTRRPTRPAARRSASTRARSPTARGRSATTSTSRSARATCRPTRCRWRSPTRRSPTAATSCARTSGCGSRTRRAARSRRSTRRPRATSTSTRPAQRTILDGLHAAAMEPGGTSYPVFGGYPVEIAGKTGTAERAGPGRPVLVHRAGAVPTTPKYVVAVTIERGGFGADAAAPAARQILDELLQRRPGEHRAGRRRTAAVRVRRSEANRAPPSRRLSDGGLPPSAPAGRSSAPRATSVRARRLRPPRPAAAGRRRSR